MKVSSTYLYLGIYNYLVTYYGMNFTLVRREDIKSIYHDIKNLLNGQSEYEFEIVDDFYKNRDLIQKSLCFNKKYMALFDIEEMNNLIESIKPENDEIVSEAMDQILEELDDEFQFLAKSNDDNTLYQINELIEYYANLQELYNVALVNEADENDNSKLNVLAKFNIEKRNSILEEICIDSLACRYINELCMIKKDLLNIELSDNNSYLLRLGDDVNLYRTIIYLCKMKMFGDKSKIKQEEENIIRYENLLLKKYDSLIELLNMNKFKKLKYQSAYLKYNTVFSDIVIETIYYNKGKYKSYINSNSCINKDFSIGDFENEFSNYLQEIIQYLFSINDIEIRQNPHLYSYIMSEIINIKTVMNNSEELNTLTHSLINHHNKKISFRNSIINNLLSNIDNIEKGVNKNYRKVKRIKNKKFLVFQDN
ncbi:MAG: hypothetical protein PUD59_04680 [bacterium]|nr:hypothetical protein [bacterium]